MRQHLGIVLGKDEATRMDHPCSCAGHHRHEGNLGFEYSLYQKICKEGVECLNEREEGSGVTVFKPWAERLNRDKYVESDEDDELLFNVPFTGNVKLKGIILVGGPDGLHPSTMKLYKNRPSMTFDEASLEADQEFELCNDQYGVHEYPVKIVKFSSVHHLSLHFTGNDEAERTRIDYIGLKGEWTPGHHHGVTICTYEARAMLKDHPTNVNSDVTKEIQ